MIESGIGVSLSFNDNTSEIRNPQPYRRVIIAISPEGTRKKVARLKSGFLRIAKETNSQIVLAGIDFESKSVHLGKLFQPSGQTEIDLEIVHNYFKQFKGKRPEFS